MKLINLNLKGNPVTEKDGYREKVQKKSEWCIKRTIDSWDD